MKKLSSLILAAVAAVVLMTCLTAKPAEAAAVYQKVYTNSSWELSERTVGGVVFSSTQDSRYTNSFYATKDGVKKSLSVMYGAQEPIITNGSTIYYAKKSGNRSVTFYKTTVKNAAPVKIRTITTEKDYLDIELQTYYGGFIYFTRDIDPGTLYRLSVKTGKYYRVAYNVTSVRKQGQYLYLMPYVGDVGPYKVRIYDMVNKTLVTLNSDVLYYKTTSKYIYYAQVTAYAKGGSEFDVSIKRANLDGSGKKTLCSSVRVGYITNITSTKVTYKLYKNGSFVSYTKSY